MIDMIHELILKWAEKTPLCACVVCLGPGGLEKGQKKLLDLIRWSAKDIRDTLLEISYCDVN